MSTHLSFYNNDTLISDNVNPSFFEDFSIPANVNLIVAYDDTNQITCNMRITAESNQSTLQFNYGADSCIFLVPSLQNHTNYSTVRCQITSSNIGKTNDISTEIQNYLQNCGVGSGSNIDFSTIVTALNSISTALSALTNLSNLSNLADLANIITVITNKDNQSDIVEELRFIFTQSQNTNTYRNIEGKNNLSVFKGNFVANSMNNLDAVARSNIRASLSNISNKLSADNDSIGNTTSVNLASKLLYFMYNRLGNLNSSLSNIETKLEQNLPFTVVVDNEIVETNVSQNCNYGSKIEHIPFSE